MSDEISLGEAARRLGVTRATLYHHIQRLSIEMTKHPLDRRVYMSIADFERIKAYREQAKQRHSEEAA